MKVIYIAGPFRSPTRFGMVENIRRAEARALEVWALGAVALCPHMNTMNFDGALPDAVWLRGDLELLHRCDALILTDVWEHSSGTQAEVAYANEHGIAVHKTLRQLRRWLEDHP